MASYILPAFAYTSRFAFQHISNYDGTSRSICRRCHGLVATSHNEYSLELAESTHVCPQPEMKPQSIQSRTAPNRVA